MELLSDAGYRLSGNALKRTCFPKEKGIYFAGFGQGPVPKSCRGA